MQPGFNTQKQYISPDFCCRTRRTWVVVTVVVYQLLIFIRSTRNSEKSPNPNAEMTARGQINRLLVLSVTVRVKNKPVNRLYLLYDRKQNATSYTAIPSMFVWGRAGLGQFAISTHSELLKTSVISVNNERRLVTSAIGFLTCEGTAHHHNTNSTRSVRHSRHSSRGLSTVKTLVISKNFQF